MSPKNSRHTSADLARGRLDDRVGWLQALEYLDVDGVRETGLDPPLRGRTGAGPDGHEARVVAVGDEPFGDVEHAVAARSVAPATSVRTISIGNTVACSCLCALSQILSSRPLTVALGSAPILIVTGMPSLSRPTSISSTVPRKIRSRMAAMRISTVPASYGVSGTTGSPISIESSRI